MSRSRQVCGGASLALVLGMGAGVFAQEDAPERRPALNFYGVPGLVDMPSGQSLPDGEIATTIAHFGGITRTTLTFQLTPRISGSFRYSGIDGFSDNFDTFYDRSFDLRLQALTEGRYRPSVVVGFQDFVGTGVYSGEYVAASKRLTPRLTATVGLGWGRLGSVGDIGSLGTRPDRDFGEGGEFEIDQFFRGPVAPFAGVEWRPTEKLTLTAEYSSDAYDAEEDRGVVDRRSPFNFGLDYRVSEAIDVGLYSLYGSEVGARVTLALNPKRPPNPASGIEAAPVPVRPRPDIRTNPDDWTTDWIREARARPLLREAVENGLDQADLRLESLGIGAREVILRFENPRYGAESQAVGRAARVLSRTMPPSVETFRLVPVVDGIAAAEIRLARRDVERYATAPEGAARILRSAEITSGGPRPRGLTFAEDLYPRFEWALGPYSRFSFFDPGEPLRASFGLQLSGSYEPAPGLVFSGAVTKQVVDNIGEKEDNSTSALPPVRTDFARYSEEGDPGISTLTAAYFFRPGGDLYGRVTAGYLERMFGGVSGELLWKPATSRLALGAELNYARQREFEQRFGFQDYDVVTGHLSAYYDFGGGYHGQLDVGRYLAGDVGATISLEREFANGWVVGAFATKTDVSAEEFGEGSFDKGIRLRIPLGYFSGKPSRKGYATTIRSLTRDGGARLRVDGRLYGKVSDYHEGSLFENSGRFWR